MSLHTSHAVPMQQAAPWEQLSGLADNGMLPHEAVTAQAACQSQALRDLSMLQQLLLTLMDLSGPESNSDGWRSGGLW